ncbi:phytoene/squalene synthase family protein [Natranaeroarchaeum sulfidigenes]|uniref:Phytoene/squalene synthetase n=1 Tax=Natranaeroarchaeum sulfidigenes TaxID=2784880 RepID=A0A897N080_9EURY|nr:phytoene/squalene synthase family protein [Natranaeroarchaeum sulfidigenes]QSG04055.1 Phytoene/squalene synthetase [Natranaeroarchaeum sulfidigenes]
MVDSKQIERTKAIQRRTGRTFHVATRFLPERARHPTYVLYAFFRVADEVVDDAGDTPPDEQAAQLESYRRQALGEEDPDGPVLEAFRDIATEYDISESEINDFIDAMKTDIHKSRYETYGELEAYMRGSAAAVGVMMTEIMDLDQPEVALPHAIALGEAFQLTNFLRDVREDVIDRDRIYLPIETLEKYGASIEDVENLEFTPEIGRAIQAEMARTEELYHEGVAGIKYLPEDCQFPVLLSAVLYADHHRLIRKLEFDTISHEPDLSMPRKLWLAARTRWHWQWNRDPEAVFQRVSTITETDTPHHDPDRPDTTPAQ